MHWNSLPVDLCDLCDPGPVFFVLGRTNTVRLAKEVQLNFSLVDKLENTDGQKYILW